MQQHEGIIVQLLAGFYDVLDSNTKDIVRTRARGNFRNKKTSPLVGDIVEFQINDDKTGYITKIKSRKNQLVRPPLSNIDQAVVVTAATQPSFSSNLLDRQLVALAEKQIDAVIYFSKTDLLSNSQFEKLNKIAKYYASIGYRVFFPNQTNKSDILNKIKSLFKGKLTIFMGQTGAGKSTLLNSIDSRLNIETGEVSKALNRGKHTTRKVSLIRINQGFVADTPGFSTYAVFEMPEQQLKNYFKDFMLYSPKCRFRECLHLNEPNCAVKEAVKNQLILQSRYENYKQFIELIRKQKPEYERKGYQKKNGRRFK